MDRILRINTAISSQNRESVEEVVESAAAAIAKQLNRDKLVGPK